MTRRTGLIVYGMVMFILTTALLILIPITVRGGLDFEQKLIMFMLALLGYSACGIIAHTLRIEREA